METKTLLNENIKNLTSLWKSASLPFKGYFERDAYTYYSVKDSDWPNRLIFKNDIDEAAFAKANSEYLIEQSPGHLSYFETYNTDKSNILQDKLIVKSVQYGMSLKLTEPFKTGSRVKFKPVALSEDARLWTELFEDCFEYRTHPKQVVLPTKNTSFYLVYNEAKDVIGTIITHSKNQDVIGIHSIGIIPKARRNGYAEELMKTILNLSIDYGFKNAVLQASEMAVPLYEKLGFVHQFKMKNYVTK